MATNQQPSTIAIQNANADIQRNVQRMQNEIAELMVALRDIDKSLGSIGLKLMETIGLDRSDVTDDKHLYILPNSKLSRNDLLRKKTLLQDRYAELTEELRGQYAIMRQLKLDIEHAQNQQQTATLKQQQLQIVKQYQADPHQFFITHIMVLNTDQKPSKEQVFTNAAELIAVSEYFDSHTDLQLIWQGWKVVAKARNIATDALHNFMLDQRKDEHIFQNLTKRNQKFAAGAKQYFVAFTNLLPLGLQGIKLLYDAKDFDRVEYYLKEAFSQASLANRTEYLQLLVDLAAEIHETCIRNSMQILSKSPDYNRLNKAQREEIVLEHAYAAQFRFDMSFMAENLSTTEMDVFRQYARLLDDHLNNQLHNPVDADVAKMEFEKLKLQITKHGSDIRSKLLNGEHSDLPEDLQLGSGLGLGWLYGVYNINASGRAIKLPELANDLSLASLLEVKDYNFIVSEDKFWSKDLELAEPTSVFGKIKLVIKHSAKKFKKLLNKPPTIDADNYNFTIPKPILLAMESMAPGFGSRLAAHFKRRAVAIQQALDQARKDNNLPTVEILSKDLVALEEDWSKIINAADDPQKFCVVVDLYLTSRYVEERAQYIDLSRDLHEEQPDPQQRNSLVFEYNHEQEEIKELHDLKYLLQQVIRPES